MEPKAPYANCGQCPLVNEPAAHGVGPDKADIVIVGEAPGAQEAKTGTPFTGPSGRLLTKLLESEGIKREEVYVTNTVLCRPPGNATPPSEAIRACEHRLEEEVKARRPRRVLALGNVAAQTILTTRTGITALRTEPPTESKRFGGAVVVPTFHPAAALRNGDYLPSIQRDLRKLTHVQVGFEYTKFGVIDDVSLVKEQLQMQLDRAEDILTLDIETDVDDMRRLDPKRPKLLCMAVSEKPGRAIVYTGEVCHHPEFQYWLNKAFQTDKKWGFQNGKFDIQHLWGLGVESARVDEDTMLAHYVTDERKGIHDLETLAVEILNAPKYKTDARQYLPHKGASYRYIPQNVLYQYNASDTDITHRLIEPLHKEMTSDDVWRPYLELLIPGSNALARAEYIGVKLDRDGLGDVGRELEAGIEQVEDGLRRRVDNPRSPLQVRAAFKLLGIETGTTDKEFLRSISHRNTEAGHFAKTLLEYRRQHKLLTTYVYGLERSQVRSRIHASFLLHGTETGRLSCRRPNLQNIPSDSSIRGLLVSGPDNILLQADYSQIEFRLAGILSGDEWLIEQFRSGRQFHKEVARELFGETYNDQEYLRAKAVNFGMLYGRGAASLAGEHGGSVSYWQRIIDNWFKQMPEVKKFQRGLTEQIREKGYLESYFGRKRRFWLVTRDNWYQIEKEGYNFPLQSTASDLTLLSLIRLEPLLRGKATPVITVHDALVWEVRREHLDEVAHVVKEVMEDTPVASICPTTVDVTVGTKWGKHMEDYVYG